MADLVVRLGRADLSALVTDEVKAQVNDMADFITALTRAALRGMDDADYRHQVREMLAAMEKHNGSPADAVDRWKQGMTRPDPRLDRG